MACLSGRVLNIELILSMTSDSFWGSSASAVEIIFDNTCMEFDDSISGTPDASLNCWSIRNGRRSAIRFSAPLI